MASQFVTKVLKEMSEADQDLLWKLHQEEIINQPFHHISIIQLLSQIILVAFLILAMKELLAVMSRTIFHYLLHLEGSQVQVFLNRLFLVHSFFHDAKEGFD